ncbi:MAG: response regulator transcription factor [Bacteroidetes bacterium]|nr:response regulator transcription factor [Bacteroidota bacterium]MCH8032971.1 response regulator transcription factor [Bacteroidota bacterium]
MKILIADDHAVVRAGLKQILTGVSGVTEIDGVANGKELMQKIKEKDFDVVVLDISMPGKSGLEVLKELKNAKPKIPVLMLSMFPEGQYAVRVLKAGASGYLTKDSASEELVNAVEKIYLGRKYITPSLAEKLADFSWEGDKFPHEKLSDREFDIFKMIASGNTVKEVAANLFLSVKTVSTYKARIYEKMKLQTRVDITSYAIKNKLID